MGKCFKCSKTVTKKQPGIQCSKCNKWLHGTCASITTEQLAALFSTESVDWKCRVCAGPAKQKRLSCILPDPEEEENSYTESCNPNVTVQKALVEIRREVREIMRNELQNSLQFFSDKIDEYEEKIKIYESDIKNVENQYTDLKNSFTNLTLKNEVLEQKINSLEQQHMSNYLEICGVPEEDQEDLSAITNLIATKMSKNVNDVVNAYRKQNNRSSTVKTTSQPAIVICLREGRRDQWLQDSKSITLTGKDIGQNNENRIYLRERLTPTTAYLLWKTKQDLKESGICKYVWCKQGQVLVKKHDKGKIHTVRSTKDIDKLISLLQE